MAGRGPAPKGRRSRDRDSPVVETLVDEGRVFGPDLPDVLEGGWHPQTVVLWDSLRRNPLLENEPPLGWQFLVDTALMHHTMWTKERWEFASEVRLRLAKFGATPEDRARLKLEVVTRGDAAKKAAAVASGEVTDMASRRARLTGTE